MQDWVSQRRIRVYLHIGLHKTGTTSFQKYCRDNHEAMLGQNLVWYRPMVDELNAHEVSLSVLRDGVMPVPSWYTNPADVSRRLQQIIDAHPGKDLLVSAEALSFIRTEVECERLRSLFGERVKDCDFVVLVVMREREDWWQSYSNEIMKTPLGPSRDPVSYRCLQQPSWLTDFEGLLDAYRRQFDDVRTITYCKSDTIPLLLAELQQDLPVDYEAIRLNQRDMIPRIRSWYKRNLAETFVGRAWRKLKRVISMRRK